ncbi:MAG TPA: acylphosphatase [Casimicrobiaceae bacterium]|nr:acylphosphatase [Casimicrobiaceae bacterium]
MKARRVVVRGRVQGVGFRDAMQNEAQREGVVGWVRNRADGTVEAWIQGDDAAVDRVVTWAARGPRAARVSEVDAVDVAADETLGDFAMRPTL